MSSQPSFDVPSIPPIGEVQHIHFLSDHIGGLFLNDEYSDVTLMVENQVLSAHKVILAARSDYFRALLFGGLKESNLSEIELKDTPLQAFKMLLRYIYTGQLSLGNQNDELVLEVLGLAHRYGFHDLQVAVSDYLEAMLSIKNVCMVYDTASLYSLVDLVTACRLYMDNHASKVLTQDSFLRLSSASVREVISRDSFCAPEVAIFKAIEKWVAANSSSSEEINSVLGAVRLSLMSTQELLSVVRPTGLVVPDVLLDAIATRTTELSPRDTQLKYRGNLLVDTNIVTEKYGATVISGELGPALIDGDTKNYDMERGFSRHPIDSCLGDKGIVVQLGTQQYIINHLRMLLWDRDHRVYSYYVEVSVDQQTWVRVVDHTKYYCRSWQDLYFPPRVVSYIRVVGTHNSVNRVFHLVALEAYYTKKQVSLDENGIIIPRQNVATIPMSAIVIEGVCRSRNALLNGDTSHYDWDSGYTCHQLGSGAIVVQLAQPYALSSMRLLLWDCDKRTYSYYIEVSLNKEDWEIVFDRSKAPCRSWQLITFPRRPVVFIRIVGTHNTANEVFHCVHLECPSVTLLNEENDLEPVNSPTVTVEHTRQSDDQEANKNVDQSLDQPEGAVSIQGPKKAKNKEEGHWEEQANKERRESLACGAGVAPLPCFPESSPDDVDSVYSRSSPNLSQHSGGQTAAESTAGRNNAGNLPVGASAHSLTNNQSQSRRSSLISTASFEQFVLRFNHRSSSSDESSRQRHDRVASPPRNPVQPLGAEAGHPPAQGGANEAVDPSALGAIPRHSSATSRRRSSYQSSSSTEH